jgi:hypothetical protein
MRFSLIPPTPTKEVEVFITQLDGGTKVLDYDHLQILERGSLHCYTLTVVTNHGSECIFQA